MTPVAIYLKDQMKTYLFSNTYGNEEQFSKKVVLKIFDVKHNQMQNVSLVINAVRDKERNQWWK